MAPESRITVLSIVETAVAVGANSSNPSSVTLSFRRVPDASDHVRSCTPPSIIQVLSSAGSKLSNCDTSCRDPGVKFAKLAVSVNASLAITKPEEFTVNTASSVF